MQKFTKPAVIAIFLAATGPATADVTDFGQGTQIGRYPSASDLSPRAEKLYREFRKSARYFGAFAANPGTGSAFYVHEFHDLQTVKRAAMEGCRQTSGQSGCQLVAIAMPHALPIDQSRASGLSESASEAFHTRYKENRKPGTFAAFAVSGANNYGFANAWKTPEYARDTALAYCRRGVATAMVEIGPQGRNWARGQRLDVCRVIHETRTPDN